MIELSAPSTPVKAAMARPLPSYWPVPAVPRASILGVIAERADRAAEAENFSSPLLAPSPPSSSATPSKRSGSGKKRRVSLDPSAAPCSCGKTWEQDSSFMVACDDCDRWYHGHCVGVSEVQHARLSRSSSVWRCRPCRKKHEAMQARTQTYCVCEGGWDGVAFMIACDGCNRWYHGACVGLMPRTKQDCTEAAFRKYTCPTCEVRTEPVSFACNSTEASSSASPMAPSSAAASTAALDNTGHGPCLLFEMLGEDELTAILTHLPIHSIILSVAGTSHRLAALCEGPVQKACQAFRWKPTRRQQGSCVYVWRALFRQRACAVCLGGSAHFPVRKAYGGSASSSFGHAAPSFRLCRTCARRDKVQSQLHHHGLEVDSIGDNGAALFARQFHTPLFGHTNGFSPNDVQVKSRTRGL